MARWRPFSVRFTSVQFSPSTGWIVGVAGGGEGGGATCRNPLPAFSAGSSVRYSLQPPPQLPSLSLSPCSPPSFPPPFPKSRFQFCNVYFHQDHNGNSSVEQCGARMSRLRKQPIVIQSVKDCDWLNSHRVFDWLAFSRFLSAPCANGHRLLFASAEVDVKNSRGKC